MNSAATVHWLTDAGTWLTLTKVMGINILLSGDNAVVIALACRGLPQEQRRYAIAWGAAGAAILLVMLTAFTTVLLAQPYLKLVGGIVLLWIAGKLMLPTDRQVEGIDSGATKLSAVKTIVMADLIMSVDNVLGVASVANGNFVLLAVGLVISVVIVVYGGGLIITLMDRLPLLVISGVAWLGYVAGAMSISDPVVLAWSQGNSLTDLAFVPLVTAAGVVLVPRVLPRRIALVEADHSATDRKTGPGNSINKRPRSP